jgi:hypothetical protein
MICRIITRDGSVLSVRSSPVADSTRTPHLMSAKMRSSWVTSPRGQFEDPTNVYPSPISSAPTAFTLLTGSSNQFVSVGASMLPVAGYQFSLNAPSSAGAKVNFVALQSGIR